jgi:hypothetical protein
MLLEKQNGLDSADALRVVEGFETTEKTVLDLCRAIGKNPWPMVAKIYGNIEETDAEKIRRALLGYFHACLARSKSPEAGTFADIIEELSESTFASGKPGLLMMIYRACEAK